ncbi:IspD/TarI family cytidylyltransferase [Actinomyces dentalis]|uniref:IspD/TarI family cytidylyltransferase n=1 Tax=Actinomyces dentalis TaxID=272548 RepID=UPI0003FD950F|nr:IspD/TarI family cytidylyltransferase [Actinomyces dentalis]
MRIDVRGASDDPAGADAAAARAGSATDDDGAVVAVLTAAGAGTRLGAGGPKALVEIGGRSLLRRAAQGLADSGVVDHLVVTAPGEHVERFTAELAGLAGAGVGIRVVAGSSASRQASVALGLKAALEACPRAAVVLVHDAARALTPPETVRRVVAAVRAGHDAVVPALAVTDTVKEVGPAGPAPAGPGDDAAAPPTARADVEVVVGTPDRSRLRAVQTPQGFAVAALVRAHELGAARGADEALAASDDAGLVEAAGGRVVVVEGDPLALKVTTPLDLALAELLAAGPAHLSSEPAETTRETGGNCASCG